MAIDRKLRQARSAGTRAAAAHAGKAPGALQGKMSDEINRSPRMSAQAKAMPVQREEDDLQMKATPVQREEDELQMKAEPVQREEDELQMKAEPVQREDELQMKAEPVQREEDELQMKAEPVQREEDELQMKAMPVQREEDELQMKAEPVQREEDDLQMKATPVQREQASAAAPNKTGLPDHLKSGIEALSGISMESVKVHYNSPQPAQLNALAYAQGTDIHVASAQEKHLPHEAWHVVQQAQGRVQPTAQMREGMPINDDAGLEHEADVMGAKALQVAGEASAQRKCEDCEVEDINASQSFQRKPAIQLYEECEASNHATTVPHRWVQRNYMKYFGNGEPEYYIKDKHDNGNFVDIVDLSDDGVYEIKPENQGASKAASEAKYYVDLLNSDVGCEGKWQMGPSFDKVWTATSKAFGLKYTAWSPEDGVILYSSKEIKM